MSFEENKALMSRQEAALNAGRADAGLDLFADPLIYNGQQVSRQVVEQTRTPFWSAIPDIRWTLEQSIAEGDWVATRWAVRGTHTGDFVLPGGGTTPASGKPIQHSYIAHYRIADGTIAEVWDASDRLALLQQLGVIPAPGQTPA